MENFGYVKKYKPILTFILCNVITILCETLLFLLCFDDDKVLIILEAIFFAIVLISEFAYTIRALIFQLKFNKNASYYFTLLDDGSLQIKGKTVDFNDIVLVSYCKTISNVFGDIKRSEMCSVYSPSVF